MKVSVKYTFLWKKVYFKRIDGFAEISLNLGKKINHDGVNQSNTAIVTPTQTINNPLPLD